MFTTRTFGKVSTSPHLLLTALVVLGYFQQAMKRMNDRDGKVTPAELQNSEMSNWSRVMDIYLTNQHAVVAAKLCNCQLRTCSKLFSERAVSTVADFPAELVPLAYAETFSSKLIHKREYFAREWFVTVISTRAKRVFDLPQDVHHGVAIFFSVPTTRPMPSSPYSVRVTVCL